MYIVTTREFRANQKKYFELAETETVFVTRKNRKPIVINVAEDDYIPRRDLIGELRGALQQVKDHMDGKIKLKSLDELIDEL